VVGDFLAYFGSSGFEWPAFGWRVRESVGEEFPGAGPVAAFDFALEGEDELGVEFGGGGVGFHFGKKIS
jgi:hypothetical protein